MSPGQQSKTASLPQSPLNGLLVGTSCRQGLGPLAQRLQVPSQAALPPRALPLPVCVHGLCLRERDDAAKAMFVRVCA